MNEEFYPSLGILQRLGLIKFRQDTAEIVLKRLRQVQIQKYSLERLNMKLRDKKSDQSQKSDILINHSLSFLFVEIDSIFLQELKFYKQSFSSLNKNLLAIVSGIKMPNLEYLDLKNCQLGSVQELNFIELSGLKKLFLNNNNLINLRTFSKFYMPKLYWLELSTFFIINYKGQNQIKETKGFNRILMARRIGLLQVSEKDSNQNKDAFTYISWWVFKLPFENINYVRKNQKYQHFRQSSIDKAMCKYPNINFR